MNSTPDTSGLSRRDMLAGMAMQGLLALKEFQVSEREKGTSWGKVVAARAVGYADALIAELDRSPPSS